MPKTQIVIASLTGAVLIAATLFYWGQPLICTCGYVRLWSGDIYSQHNSQHIADWYTLSHFLHGVLGVVVARIFFPNVPFKWVFTAIVTTGIAWEITEHTHWVLDRFRAATISQGYVGDSILNAMADYFWMLLGFFVAYKMRGWYILAMVVLLELSAALAVRDSLTLSTLMLIYPVETVKEWQLAIRPDI